MKKIVALFVVLFLLITISIQSVQVHASDLFETTGSNTKYSAMMAYNLVKSDIENVSEDYYVTSMSVGGMASDNPGLGIIFRIEFIVNTINMF